MNNKHRRVNDNDDTGEHARTWGGWLGQRSIKEWLSIFVLLAVPGQFIAVSVYKHAASLFELDRHLVTEEVLEATVKPLGVQIQVIQGVVDEILHNQKILSGRTSGVIATPTIKGVNDRAGAHNGTQ